MGVGHQHVVRPFNILIGKLSIGAVIDKRIDQDPLPIWKLQFIAGVIDPADLNVIYRVIHTVTSL